MRDRAQANGLPLRRCARFIGPLFLVTVCAFFGSVQCSLAADPNEIVIGPYASMTGSEATFGRSTDNGIRLAIAEINAAGGIGSIGRSGLVGRSGSWRRCARLPQAAKRRGRPHGRTSDRVEACKGGPGISGA